jgi:hypothetical protein
LEISTDEQQIDLVSVLMLESCYASINLVEVTMAAALNRDLSFG